MGNQPIRLAQTRTIERGAVETCVGEIGLGTPAFDIQPHRIACCRSEPRVLPREHGFADREQIAGLEVERENPCASVEGERKCSLRLVDQEASGHLVAARL